MLNSVKQAIYNVYSWLTRKLRLTALDFIALFNKEYADSKRITLIWNLSEKYDPPKLKLENLFDVELIKTEIFDTSDLLIRRDINLRNIELKQERDSLSIFSNQDCRNLSRDLFSGINYRDFNEINLSVLTKPNFSRIISKLNQDEYAKYINNLGFIFPLMLRYENFVYSNWISDKHSNSALVQLIQTCDSRKAMEKKIDLWEREKKLLLDRYIDADTLIHITVVFLSAGRAIKDGGFIKACNSGYSYQGHQDVLYELVTSLREGRRNLIEAREVVKNLIINYEKYDNNRDLVFLLKLVCKTLDYNVLIRRVIINHNSRDAMIEEIYSLQKEEMLCVDQKKLDYIIKILPILEKKSHESYDSVATAVRSEDLGKLEEILVDHIHIAQEKIKSLTGQKGLVLNLKPVSTLEVLSIAALEKHRLLE